MPDLGAIFTHHMAAVTRTYAGTHARTHIICVSQLSALHDMMKNRLQKVCGVWFRQSQQGLAISSAVWSRLCAKTSASSYARCCTAFRGTWYA